MLVVDDDTLFRRLLRALLEDEGYTVREAPDGQVALDILRHMAERVVIVVNHQMPRLNGAGLIQAVLADPQIYGRRSFLYTTAADELLAPSLRQQLAELRVPLLRKPFDLDVFLEAVAHAAEQSSGFSGGDGAPAPAGRTEWERRQPA